MLGRIGPDGMQGALDTIGRRRYPMSPPAFGRPSSFAASLAASISATALFRRGPDLRVSAYAEIGRNILRGRAFHASSGPRNCGLGSLRGPGLDALPSAATPFSYWSASWMKLMGSLIADGLGKHARLGPLGGRALLPGPALRAADGARSAGIWLSLPILRRVMSSTATRSSSTDPCPGHPRLADGILLERGPAIPRRLLASGLSAAWPISSAIASRSGCR